MTPRQQNDFWKRVAIMRFDSCWEWQGRIKETGYGTHGVGHASRSRPAHRFAYELLVGPIPKGMHLDHLCNNRVCCNPFHLEPVTPLENVRRALHHVGHRTHCRLGHEYSLENTYEHRGKRHCRKCTLIAKHKYRANGGKG